MTAKGDRCAPSSTRELTRTTQSEHRLRSEVLVRLDIDGANAAERLALGESFRGDDLTAA